MELGLDSSSYCSDHFTQRSRSHKSRSSHLSYSCTTTVKNANNEKAMFVGYLASKARLIAVVHISLPWGLCVSLCHINKYYQKSISH